MEKIKEEHYHFSKHKAQVQNGRKLSNIYAEGGNLKKDSKMAPSSEKGCIRRFTDGLSCRRVLNIMVFFGFMVNYMLRVNMTIAIVEMVHPAVNNASDTSEFMNNSAVGVTECGFPIEKKFKNQSIVTERKSDDHVRFDWDESQQNLILGSFFWGYVCTELPGGRLAEVVGARRVFGYSMLVSSLVTLLTPLAATTGYPIVIILRVVLGFMLGATWPAMHLQSQWIPHGEKSVPSSLGAAITLPVCGYLLAWLGWESVFYITGVIGLLWSISWFLLVFDTPAQHPRISPEERAYIEESIGTGTTTSHKALKVPWKRIFTSLPVWAIIITHGCSVFGYFTIVNQLPTFMKYILAFNIKENGLLSSLPYLGKYLMAVSTSYIADWLRSSGKLSTTATRKLFTTCGTIFGLANTLSSFGGYLSTYMVGKLTVNNQTFSQWQIVFYILAGTYTFGGLVFLIFGTGKMQSWNSPAGPNREINNHNKDIVRKNKEVIPLQKK
ncbi:hypothetical protein LSTR_LSTR007867 [Laodelphax striatellus]|uniref:Major facilitator superfamily (MFS) profile domain-containing protein n=1 Tax=Laodelphax striatellus TaxID=195883 RepID=A0A482WNJ2_LAOST|nr:hypothetical protein LSTR_LSTR007867 [Laodelphax striatellus]